MKKPILNYYCYNGQIITTNNLCFFNKVKSNSIYEVIRVIDGKLLFFKDHIDRFKNSINELSYKFDITDDEIINQIEFLLSIEKVSDINIKIIYIPYKEDFDLIICFSERILPTNNHKSLGVNLKTLKIERKIPNIKTIGDSYKEQISKYSNEEIFEILLIDNNNVITEGTKSNIFLIKNKTLYTTEINKVLPGITRKYVMEICNENNIQIIEQNLNKEELNNIDGAFLTGTSIDILPVKKIDNIIFDVKHPIIKIISDNYFKKVKENLI